MKWPGGVQSLVSLCAVAVFVSGCGQESAADSSSVQPVEPTFPSEVNYDAGSVKSISVDRAFTNKYWSARWLDSNGRTKGICISGASAESGSLGTNCYESLAIKRGNAIQQMPTGNDRFEVLGISPKSASAVSVSDGTSSKRTSMDAPYYSTVTGFLVDEVRFSNKNGPVTVKIPSGGNPPPGG